MHARESYNIDNTHAQVSNTNFVSVHGLVSSGQFMPDDWLLQDSP